MASSNTEQYLAVAGIRVKPAHTHFIHLKDELRAVEHSSELFSRRHPSHQLQPHLHCARVGVGELLRVRHLIRNSNRRARWVIPFSQEAPMPRRFLPPFLISVAVACSAFAQAPAPPPAQA